MIQELEKILLTSYTKIPSSLDNISLYVKSDTSDDETVGLQLLDYTGRILPTTDQYELIRKRAVEYMAKEKKPVRLLSVVFTHDVAEARKFVLLNHPCWIVDSKNKKLLLYENQRGDYYGVRELIEKVCDSSEDVLAPDRSEGLLERGKKKARDFFLSHTPVNLMMFIINIGVYLFMLLTGSPYDLDYMLDHGAMYVPYIIKYGQYYRLFTCMFIHFGIQHLIGNMIVLFFLGDNLERAVGKIKYLVIFLFSGFCGSVGSFVFSYIYNKNIMSAGASGAVFGIIGALLWVVIKEKGKLEDMTTFRIVILIVYALYSGIASQNIDNAAHISGLVAGFLMSVILYRPTGKGKTEETS